MPSPLDPNVILTRNILGFCLAAQGRLDEGLASIQRCQELDPLAAARWNELAMCYNAMGRYEEAVDAAKQAIKLDPNFSQDARCHGPRTRSHRTIRGLLY